MASMAWEAAAATLHFTPDQARDVSPQGLTARYRKLMRHNHLDHGGNNERAVRINAARDVLRDWIRAGRPVADTSPKPDRESPSPFKPAQPPSRQRPRTRLWRYLRATCASGALLMATLVMTTSGSKKMETRAPEVVRRAMAPPAPRVFDNKLPSNFHKPNSCVYDSSGRCMRVFFDAWKGDP